MGYSYTNTLGFASSRLMAWKLKTCGSGFNINIGDRVWLDVAHVLYDSFRVGRVYIQFSGEIHVLMVLV